MGTKPAMEPASGNRSGCCRDHHPARSRRSPDVLHSHLSWDLPQFAVASGPCGSCIHPGLNFLLLWYGRSTF